MSVVEDKISYKIRKKKIIIWWIGLELQSWRTESRNFENERCKILVPQEKFVSGWIDEENW